MKGLKLLSVLTIGAFLMTGCQTNVNRKQVEVKTVLPGHTPAHQMKLLQDASVIPSTDRIKKQTTNEHGLTTYGLGSSVYSQIGSSGLHGDGISNHLESRLSSKGIKDVKVFVFDDTLILATVKRELTATRYDPMQEKVLSGTAGFSGRGKEPGKRVGTYGTGDKVTGDNLDMAAKELQTILGGKVHVLKIVSPKAVETITRMRSYTDDPTAHARHFGQDIQLLLELAAKSGR
ncbi:hypothetical protein Back11_20670 [Paenibacillus baekrokdamisoli]|uniref:Uncharacterized protein n=1 Tax=Paenibacillus baekrokdamisoli TaxID=1712516 RepID=A0A3G9IR19_9BACL|nr:hypothetical protein [Paenibacillus baekrokdamisoli]MBB3069925.1 hypothetical protein [Paenibacillus baekrokdamisoli]BBH20722.1 hypothetical protein Back11_20670 [Paenibacillus baekrokdamisoli]